MITRVNIMANGSKRLIPLAAMERILKQAGADRVSDKAKVALKAVVEDMAEKISQDAVKFAAHAGRTWPGDLGLPDVLSATRDRHFAVWL